MSGGMENARTCASNVVKRVELTSHSQFSVEVFSEVSY